MQITTSVLNVRSILSFKSILPFIPTQQQMKKSWKHLPAYPSLLILFQIRTILAHITTYTQHVYLAFQLNPEQS